MQSMNTNESRHLCGHLPLVQTALTSTTFCAKCVAWNCQTVNCSGHMRSPEQGEVQS